MVKVIGIVVPNLSDVENHKVVKFEAHLVRTRGTSRFLMNIQSIRSCVGDGTGCVMPNEYGVGS